MRINLALLSFRGLGFAALLLIALATLTPSLCCLAPGPLVLPNLLCGDPCALEIQSLCCWNSTTVANSHKAGFLPAPTQHVSPKSSYAGVRRASVRGFAYAGPSHDITTVAQHERRVVKAAQVLNLSHVRAGGLFFSVVGLANRKPSILGTHVHAVVLANEQRNLHLLRPEAALVVPWSASFANETCSREAPFFFWPRAQTP